ncbi:hypothetical protein UFOVP457_27 [uncultured Caudovirales phage]|uniref:Uncharacterized protein n=1 Tax=uncultured Caudovirales phage TaxID=2100421 RepID=A0A6J5MKT5_9CAUD|nr:hypothetical protein UFOVP457_27 [uncultured Caudovirales phage]
MSINATALYPWLQTPIVEKFPPENKMILTAYTDITVTGTADFTVFDSGSIGGFTNGGILMDIQIYRNSTSRVASEAALQFYGYKANLNGGGLTNYLAPSNLPHVGIIADNTGSGQYGQLDLLMFQQFMGIRFTNSLRLDLRLDRSGSNLTLVCMAKYYKL